MTTCQSLLPRTVGGMLRNPGLKRLSRFLSMDTGTEDEKEEEREGGKKERRRQGGREGRKEEGGEKGREGGRDKSSHTLHQT